MQMFKNHILKKGLLHKKVCVSPFRFLKLNLVTIPGNDIPVPPSVFAVPAR